MTLTINAAQLLQALKAAKVTTKSSATDETKNIRLSTCRIPTLSASDESAAGHTTYLVAAGYDGIMYGQAVAPGNGDMFEPVLLDPTVVAWVETAVKTVKTKTKAKNEDIDIALSVNETTRQMTYTTLLNGEKTADSVVGQFPIYDDAYDVDQVALSLTPPIRNTVEGPTDQQPIPADAAVGFDSHMLGALKSVLSAYSSEGLPIRVYWRGNPANDRIVAVGDKWRGTIPGVVLDFAHSDPYEPDLPVLVKSGDEEADEQ